MAAFSSVSRVTHTVLTMYDLRNDYDRENVLRNRRNGKDEHNESLRQRFVDHFDICKRQRPVVGEHFSSDLQQEHRRLKKRKTFL